MRHLSPDAIAGLRRIYAHTGRTIFVYEDGTGDMQFMALHPDDAPPPCHRDSDSHTLAGTLDLMSGRVSGRPPRPTTDDQQQYVDMLMVVLKACWQFVQVFVTLCFAGVVFILLLCMAMGWSGGGGRRSHR